MAKRKVYDSDMVTVTPGNGVGVDALKEAGLDGTIQAAPVYKNADGNYRTDGILPDGYSWVHYAGQANDPSYVEQNRGSWGNADNAWTSDEDWNAIQSYKQQYEQAKAAGDTAGMEAAHAAAEKLLIGAIEMSSGVASLSGSAGSMSTQLSLAAFILGWAGLCVHCQVLSFLGSSDLSVRTYLAGKLAHGAISAALAGVLIRVLPMQLPVSAVYAQQINVLTGIGFSRALAAASTAAAVTWLAFLLVALAACRKSAGNSGRKHV